MPDDEAFEAIQYYNKIICNKKLKGITLKEKIESEKEWICKCRKAFDDANGAIFDMKYKGELIMKSMSLLRGN